MEASFSRFTRRQILGTSVGLASASFLAACGATPTPEIIEMEKVVTQIVEKEVTTIVVPTQQIIEKEVVVTATPSAEQMSASQRIILEGPQGEGNSDPMSMGHWFSNSGIKPALWCTLVGLDKDLNLYPWGAESWSFDDSTMVWTFNIRQGMKFSDGSDITANDFAYSMKRSIKHIDPEFHAAEVAAGRSGTTATFASTMLSDVDGVSELRAGNITGAEWEEQYGSAINAKDDYTLELRVANVVPENLLMGKLAYNGSQVCKQENVEAGTPELPWYENPVTSGPFMVDTHVIDQYWTLVPNPYYAGGDPPFLKEAQLRIFTDAQTKLIAYENNEIDAIRPGEADALEYLNESHPRHAELTTQAFAIISYTWFVNLPPIDDVHVRRALMRAIDRETTVNAVFRGTAMFSKTYIPDYTPGWEIPPNYDDFYLSYDVAAAMDELKQSRYYDQIMSGEQKIRMQFPQGTAQSTGGRLLEAYVDQWRTNLGIEVSLQQTEFEMEGAQNTLWNLRSNGRGLLYADIDAWVSNVMSMYDPAGTYAYLMTNDWTDTTDIFAMARIEDADDEARFTQLWKEAAIELDAEKRLAMYQEWECLREKWAIEVPHYYPYLFMVAQPWVKDLELTPQAGMLMHRAWIAAH